MKLESLTDSPVASKRWYDDACGTALAMELVGERWSLLIVRELMFGPRRFGELKTSLNGISANTLSVRLDGLERARILMRRLLPPPANAQVFELTPWGYESERAIQELGRWAVRSPRSRSDVAAVRRFADDVGAHHVCRGHAGHRGFRFGRETFVATLTPEAIVIRRDDPAEADVVFDADQQSIAAVIYGGRPLADALADGSMRLTGKRAVAEDYVTRFPLPEKCA